LSHHRSHRIIRRLGLLAFAAAAVASVPPAAGAARYERDIDLTARAPRLVQEASGSGWSWEGARLDGEVGDPQLPWHVMRVALRPDERIVDVRIEPLDEVDVLSVDWLRPVPDVDPQGVDVPVALDPDRYLSESVWPADPARMGEVGFIEGHRVTAVSVCPVSYRPHDGELTFMPRFRVVIETAATETPADLAVPRRAPDATYDVRRALERRVDWVANAINTATRVAGDASTTFRPSRRPSLDGSGVDFVIVTPAAFADEFQRLAAWRTRSGIRTVVRTSEWILENYDGEDLQARIRTFFRDAYTNWGTRYALIGADHDFIPVRYARSRHRTASEAGVDLATDFYYACLDGNWNANGNHLVGEGIKLGEIDEGEDDAADLGFELKVGRLPARSATDARVLVDKTLGYEGADPTRFDATYQETLSFYSEVLFWRNSGIGWNNDCDDISFDGTTLARTVVEDHLSPALQSGTNMFLEAYACPDNLDLSPIPENKSVVLEDLNSGRNLVVHIGHGARDNMALGAPAEKLVIADADDLTNGDRTSILYAINCNSGAVDFDSLCEHFLGNPNGGAAGVIAAMDLDYPSTSNLHLYGFFDRIKLDPSMNLGDLFFETLDASYYSCGPCDVSRESSRRWTMFTLVLMADPTMVPWSTAPARMEASFPSFYLMGQGAFGVTVTEEGSFDDFVGGATVTLHKNGEYYASQVTGGDGQANFDLAVVTPGQLSVTVTKATYQPFIGTSTLSPPGVPHIAVSDVTIDDSAGNGNGRIDPGESVAISFDIVNSGGSSATAIALVASEDSPYASLTTSSTSAPDIPGGSTGTSGSITLTAADGVPLRHRPRLFRPLHHRCDRHHAIVGIHHRQSCASARVPRRRRNRRRGRHVGERRVREHDGGCLQRR
jgi:hypothetical protein